MEEQQNAEYLQLHGIHKLFEELTEQLVHQKPEDIMPFLAGELSKRYNKERTKKVIFVLGAPGTGKGTQCKYVVDKYQFQHLSAGDLLRAEVNRKSPLGAHIEQCMAKGELVDGAITIGLLREHIERAPDNTTFLVDGFPREMAQALHFEIQVQPCAFVINFVGSESVLTQRLLERGKTSGRPDDNIDSIKLRMQHHKELTVPVTEYYRAKKKLFEIDAEKSPTDVREAVFSVIDSALA
eukprot:NODE_3805_length_849_cov_65.937673_g3782_i0.p1 GENE.NODE_3805_length_849_cov_65.937673_g3782_i0~~NODE_3805_length_849_cov_65.937673_g3782_i0.p1  ORF type:complete len:239 (+),score=40.35 NODE_3805_length_849_cov_65.937673_g3782_i0:78-794(+)